MAIDSKLDPKRQLSLVTLIITLQKIKNYKLVVSRAKKFLSKLEIVHVEKMSNYLLPQHHT